jgi:hypothetical protein
MNNGLFLKYLTLKLENPVDITFLIFKLREIEYEQIANEGNPSAIVKWKEIALKLLESEKVAKDHIKETGLKL